MNEVLQRHPRKVAASGAALALIAAASGPVISKWEGERTTTYFDSVKIVTVCKGHTGKDLQGRPLKLHMNFTKAECAKLFTDDQTAVIHRISDCTKGQAPVEVWSAMTSFSFNAGSGRYCKNFAPLIDRGDLAGACAKLALYDKAHAPDGRLVQIPGLANRRRDERTLCERGL